MARTVTRASSSQNRIQAWTQKFGYLERAVATDYIRGVSGDLIWAFKSGRDCGGG